MDPVLRRVPLELLDHLANQQDMFYSPSNMIHYNENEIERWDLQKESPSQDMTLQKLGIPAYYSSRDEASLLIEKSNTNITTNLKLEQEHKKRDPRKVKREPHNAVERKRRNNINENIKYLGQLLPENMCQGKVSKGTILKGSVQYVKTLKDQLINYKLRLDFLERQVAALNGNQANLL